MQMTVVCLVADHGSPLRTLPDRERREKACEIAGYKFEEGTGRLAKNARDIVYGKIKVVEVAIAKYREIQYDETRDMLEAIDAQIQEAISMMKMDKFEACTVKKTRILGNGDQTVEEYVDNIQAVKLAESAMKLGGRLSELKEQKETLLSTIKNETQIEITTYTSSDIDGASLTEGQSVLDTFMQNKILKESGA